MFFFLLWRKQMESDPIHIFPKARPECCSNMRPQFSMLLLILPDQGDVDILPCRAIREYQPESHLQAHSECSEPSEVQEMESIPYPLYMLSRRENRYCSLVLLWSHEIWKLSKLKAWEDTRYSSWHIQGSVSHYFTFASKYFHQF